MTYHTTSFEIKKIHVWVYPIGNSLASKSTQTTRLICQTIDFSLEHYFYQFDDEVIDEGVRYLMPILIQSSSQNMKYSVL